MRVKQLSGSLLMIWMTGRLITGCHQITQVYMCNKPSPDCVSMLQDEFRVIMNHLHVLHT